MVDPVDVESCASFSLWIDDGEEVDFPVIPIVDVDAVGGFADGGATTVALEERREDSLEPVRCLRPSAGGEAAPGGSLSSIWSGGSL